MKNIDLVSIIVPIYNIQNYVEKCIESLISQKYDNIEILLINDGSTDNSKKLCEKYVDNKKVFLYNKSNGGLSDARNYGLKFAKGKYIIFVDGDDYVEENFVEDLYQSISEYKSDVAICEYSEITDNDKYIRTVKLNEPVNLTVITGIDLLHYFYKPGGVINQVVWNKIYKKELFNTTKFAKGKYYEDGYIIAPLYWNVKKISFVRRSLYNYVQRENSIMHTGLSKKKIEDAEGTYKYRLNFFENREKDLYNLAANDYKNWILSFTTSYLLKNRNTTYIKYLQKEYNKYSKLGCKNNIKYKIINNIASRSIIMAAYGKKIVGAFKK